MKVGSNWKALPYRLSSEVKEYLIDMHFLGELAGLPTIDYEHVFYTGEYKGRHVDNVDLGFSFGYFDFRKVPNLQRDIKQIPKELKILSVVLGKTEPNLTIPLHSDTPAKYRGFGRRCSINFPITPEPDQYATVHFGNGCIPYHECILINTDVDHGVFNNDNFRMNLQLQLGQTFEEVEKILLRHGV